MSSLPENLQIKSEPSPPSTPEDKSPKNIKAKLNLHVKRRLQDFNHAGSENAIFSEKKPQVSVADIKQEPSKNETIRQKRPYHKRTDKNKSQSSDNTCANEATTTSQRKYKHKIKQIVANDNQDMLTINPNEENAAINLNATAAGAISAGDDDDNELKGVKEKEKCPDVLGMVLSMKKRALMQDPEVQSFLKEIMDMIKS